MSELDLDRGDSSYGEGSSAAERRRARRSTSGVTAEKKEKKEGPSDSELKSRIGRTFEKIAEWRDAHDDEELATVIREESDAMEGGIMSVVGSIPFMRLPLFWILAIAEPVLAFGKVTRILVYRWYARRERIEQERQMEAQASQWSPEGEVIAGS